MSVWVRVNTNIPSHRVYIYTSASTPCTKNSSQYAANRSRLSRVTGKRVNFCHLFVTTRKSPRSKPPGRLRQLRSSTSLTTMSKNDGIQHEKKVSKSLGCCFFFSHFLLLRRRTCEFSRSFPATFRGMGDGKEAACHYMYTPSTVNGKYRTIFFCIPVYSWPTNILSRDPPHTHTHTAALS